MEYPLSFHFKIGTLANDFIAKDANGKTIAYVRQKMFKLKEEVIVFADESKQKELFRINADKWLDFNTTYSFSSIDTHINNIGRIARKGWRSIWKAEYELYDENDQKDLIIKEESAWVKVFDAFLGEIPILSFFTGYFFNPKYNIVRPNEPEKLVAQIVKEKSFFGRRFTVNKHNSFEKGEELRILLGSMMMILLERRRG